ncbi:MAG: hypothetical protein EXS17_08560 [Phycisphaerales bacterium]|nr:hypothetical protein [Phycisphaerales bacterium]
MASRTGSSGPLVALVVFVVLAVLSMVATIYFYSEMNTAVDAMNIAKAKLKEVITEEQAQGSRVQAFQSGATQNNQTLVQHIVERQEAIATLVVGDPNADLDQLRAALALSSEQTVTQALESLRRDLASAQSKVQDQIKRSAQITAQAEATTADAAAKSLAADERVAQLTATLAPYRASSERALGEIGELKNELIQARDQARDEFANQLAEEKGKQAVLVATTQNLIERVNVLQKQLEQFRIKPRDPALLVDGRIVDLGVSDNQVYISLGSKNHVRPGMTFEVYPDSSAIMYDAKTDRQSPGKASIEIIKVGDTTSTARVTRSKRGSSVSRGDVLANAIYSPDYQYKFLVHGKFDVDTDGKVTDGEANYIRGKIQEWGGTIIDGDTLTPDVDFVVIGTVPPRRMAQPLGEDSAAYSAYLAEKRAYDAYEELAAAAKAAQVPVLNWNRFQILTGAAER